MTQFLGLFTLVYSTVVLCFTHDFPLRTSHGIPASVCFVLFCMPFETRSSTELKARSIHLRMLSDKDWFPKLRTNLLIIRQTLTLFGVHRPNAVRTPALAWDPGPCIKIHLIVRPSSDVRWQNSGCQSIQDALTMVSAPLDTFALLL